MVDCGRMVPKPPWRLGAAGTVDRLGRNVGFDGAGTDQYWNPPYSADLWVYRHAGGHRHCDVVESPQEPGDARGGPDSAAVGYSIARAEPPGLPRLLQRNRRAAP